MLDGHSAPIRHGVTCLLIFVPADSLKKWVAVVGTHSSPVMRSALALYLRMAFVLQRPIPDRFGAPRRLFYDPPESEEHAYSPGGGVR
jgi:hypothetical protein